MLAAEAPLRALALRVAVPLAEADQAFTRRTLGQHERAVSFMVALAAERTVSTEHMAGHCGRPHCAIFADGHVAEALVLVLDRWDPTSTLQCRQGSEIRTNFSWR